LIKYESPSTDQILEKLCKQGVKYYILTYTNLFILFWIYY